MRRLLLLGSVFALGAGLLPASAASAQVVQASSIEANVLGTTEGGSTCMPTNADQDDGIDLETLAPCTPGGQTATGKFNDIVLSGVFTAVDGEDVATCATSVTITSGDGSVGFSEPDNVLMSSGDLTDEEFGGSTGALCSVVEGSLLDGSYERVGSVAVAHLKVHFKVCISVDGIEKCVWGWVYATAYVTAVPGAGAPPLDPSSAGVAGVVVGQCPPDQVDPDTECAMVAYS